MAQILLISTIFFISGVHPSDSLDLFQALESKQFLLGQQSYVVNESKYNSQSFHQIFEHHPSLPEWNTTEIAQADTSDEAIATISDEELARLATVLLEFQALETSYREQSLLVIDREGLTAERFDQLVSLLRSPEAPENESISEPSAEENAQFENALTQIGVIQDEIQAQAQQVISSEGFTIDEIETLIIIVNNDPAMEERLRELMESILDNQT